MILSIGEILADLIGEKENDGLNIQSFCGGAPKCARKWRVIRSLLFYVEYSNLRTFF